MDREMMTELLGFGVLFLASVQDIRKREIPVMVFAAAAVTGTLSVLLTMTDELQSAALSVIPGILLLAAAFLSREGIGYGDGLLVLLLGPVYGWMRLSAGICVAFLLTALVCVVLLVLRRVHRSSRLPFVPFLTAAMGVIHFVYSG